MLRNAKSFAPRIRCRKLTTATKTDQHTPENRPVVAVASSFRGTRLTIAERFLSLKVHTAFDAGGHSSHILCLSFRPLLASAGHRLAVCYPLRFSQRMQRSMHWAGEQRKVAVYLSPPSSDCAEQNSSVECPRCLKVFVLSADGVAGLMKNYDILPDAAHMLAERKEQKEEKVKKTEKTGKKEEEQADAKQDQTCWCWFVRAAVCRCREKPATPYCGQCLQNFCAKCDANIHKFNASKTHKRTDTDR